MQGPSGSFRLRTRRAGDHVAAHMWIHANWLRLGRCATMASAPIAGILAAAFAAATPLSVVTRLPNPAITPPTSEERSIGRTLPAASQITFHRRMRRPGRLIVVASTEDAHADLDVQIQSSSGTIICRDFGPKTDASCTVQVIADLYAITVINWTERSTVVRITTSVVDPA